MIGDMVTGVVDFVQGTTEKTLEVAQNGAENTTEEAIKVAPPPFGDRNGGGQIDRWMKQFWEPIYRAACVLPHPKYNAEVRKLESLAKDVVAQRGLEFAPDWYYEQGMQLVVPEDAYVQRRAELGCSSSSSSSGRPLAALLISGAALGGVAFLIAYLLERK